MKKLSIAAVAAFAAFAAAPVVAQEATVAADPFVSTQGETTALAIIGGVTLLVLVAASGNDGGSSSSTGTN